MSEPVERRVPPRPERPPEPTADDRRSWVPILLAMLASLVILIVMSFLTGGFIVVKFFAAGLIATGLIAGFVGLSYFVWGSLLSRIIEREEHDDSESG